MLYILLLAPSLVAQARGEAQIEIDGRLDEAAWSAAAEGTGFVERSPQPGRKPAAPTSVRVLFDAEAVYVGVRATRTPDETPRGLELRRDNFRIWSDDAITLKFDVRHDERNTVGFAVNVSGATIDYVAAETGGFRREYDAVWQVATSLSPDAWFAEFRIPWPAMGAASGTEMMGLQVTRDHNAAQATYDWAAMPQEFGPTSEPHYGDLTGLKAVSGGQPVAHIPFVLARHPGRDAWSGDQIDLRAGGDLRLRMGADTWGELTVLTDFAEVDLDDALINVDRFPLFLPEKRPFFLTGVDVFDFGDRGAVQPFFSRRIGLDATGQEIPVYAGAKVYGRSGAFSYGVLDVVTGEEGDASATNHGVLRTLVEPVSGLQLGMIGVARTEIDAPDSTPHFATGADLNYRGLSDRLQITGFYSNTLDDDPAEGLQDGHATRAEVAYRGAMWQPSAKLRWVDAGFAPRAGFVRRSDALLAQTNHEVVFRWAEGLLDNLTPGVAAAVTWDADGEETLDEVAQFDLNARFRSGWSTRLTAVVQRMRVQSDFEALGSLPVEADRYSGTILEASLDSPFTRNPGFSLSYAHEEGYFGGRRDGLSGSLGAYLGAHFRTDATVRWQHATIDGASADALAGNGTLTYAVSTALFADVGAAIDGLSETSTGLGRLRWRYLPGSDLWFVWREGFAWAEGEASERRVTLKLNYWYDAVL